MKTKYPKMNFDHVQTYPISQRESKVNTDDFSQPVKSSLSIKELFEHFPNILAAKDLKKFISQVKQAIQYHNEIIWMMGAHSIKCGLSPLINQLVEKKIITHLALNGASAIHDVELAMWGKTSEDVAVALQDGSFGMCKDTADFINGSLTDNTDNEKGYGECIAEKLNVCNAPNNHLSLLHTCYKNNVSFSVHSALGTEIIHQHPSLNGNVYGEKSLLDFQLFAHALTKLKKDSIVINLGSAVIMPEIFLKALTVVRNLKYDAYGFHTAVFDMIRHYRPTENVQRRPTQKQGDGYYFIGHFEIMLPLFIALLIDE